jgi:hypothetical protein
MKDISVSAMVDEIAIILRCFAVVLLGMLGLVAYLLLTAPDAAAHSWYDASCCNNRDCGPLQTFLLIEEAEGYRVKYVSPITGNEIEGFVRYRDVKPSRDQNWHACETPQKTVRCLYGPMSS